jgi:2',3'-cyclic-nucleotide 2'-phosphodiesterase (5'-nucleotidase family)
VFAPHAVVEATSASGGKKVRVGVIGVARYNPVFQAVGPDGSSILIDHPVERVRREVEALRQEGVELIVLLAALHRSDADQIARAELGVDYVLGSFGGLVTDNPERVGEATIVYDGNRGQRVRELQVFLDRTPERTVVRDTVSLLHFLTREYPEDPAMREFIDSAAPGRKDSEPSTASAVAPPPTPE